MSKIGLQIKNVKERKLKMNTFFYLKSSFCDYFLFDRYSIYGTFCKISLLLGKQLFSPYARKFFHLCSSEKFMNLNHDTRRPFRQMPRNQIFTTFPKFHFPTTGASFLSLTNNF